MMNVKTEWTMFGYPGLAITLFLAAVAGGVWMLVNIFVWDEKRDKTKK